MNSDSSENDWYGVLGLASAATDEEIRRAYYGLVRRFPPRRFPADFQRITRAYYVLGDTRRKAEYDQGRASGRRVQVLVDQAALAADKDAQKAMMLLKHAVALAPDMPRPRALLAHVLMRIEEFAVAERQYLWLLRYAPSDETIRLRLARCLFRQGRLADAEAHVREALKLNPGYHDAITLLSEICAAGRRREDQAEVLERAVLNDGVVNWADFDALAKLLVLRLQQGDADMIEAASARLQAVVSPEKAIAAIQRLTEQANQLKDQEQLPQAQALLEHASRITLPDEAAQEGAGLAQQQRRLAHIAEARSLVCDTLVRGGLQALLNALYLEESKNAVRQSRLQAALDTVKREIEAEPKALIGQLEYIRKEYPLIGEDQAAVFGQLRRRAEARLEQIAQEAPPRSTDPPAEANAPRRSGFFDRLMGTS